MIHTLYSIYLGITYNVGMPVIGVLGIPIAFAIGGAFLKDRP